MEELNTSIYYPIGTIGIINDRKVKVMPANGSLCTNCVFTPGCVTNKNCTSVERKDRINIIYEVQI